MSKPSAKPTIELPELFDLPRLEDFIVPNHGGVRDRAGRKRTGRKNITIYVRGELLESLGPNPGTQLRIFLESEFQKGRLGRIDAGSAKQVKS